MLMLNLRTKGNYWGRILTYLLTYTHETDCSFYFCFLLKMSAENSCKQRIMPSSLLELQPAAYLTLLICYLEKASYLLFNTTV